MGRMLMLLALGFSLTTMSSGEVIQGTVRGIVDLPDYCDTTQAMPLAGVQLDVEGKVYHANRNGAFTITVSGPGPVEVVARLRSGGTPAYYYEVVPGPDSALVECVPGVPCAILFDNENSEPPARTTYYWAHRTFELVDDVLGCHTPVSPLRFTVNGGRCNASFAAPSQITLGREEFPCGSCGRIATVVQHEIAHWLDYHTSATPESWTFPFQDESGSQGMADGLGIFIMNFLGYTSGGVAGTTARGFYLNKCAYGLRHYDAFKHYAYDRLVPDAEYPFDSEILSNFYWDVAQQIPALDALGIFLSSVCDPDDIRTMPQAVGAFCEASPPEYYETIKTIAEAHGLPGCGRYAVRPGPPGASGSRRFGTAAMNVSAAGLCWTIGPNPARPAVAVHLTVSRKSNVTADIYDAGGRAVYQLHQGETGSGEVVLEWRGVNGKGEQVPAGVYFVRLNADGGVGVLKVVVLR